MEVLHGPFSGGGRTAALNTIRIIWYFYPGTINDAERNTENIIDINMKHIESKKSNDISYTIQYNVIIVMLLK